MRKEAERLRGNVYTHNTVHNVFMSILLCVGNSSTSRTLSIVSKWEQVHAQLVILVYYVYEVLGYVHVHCDNGRSISCKTKWALSHS